MTATEGASTEARQEREDGGPAFPRTAPLHGRDVETGQPYEMPAGMSLRDYFAGQALMGLIASDRFTEELDERSKDSEFDDLTDELKGQAQINVTARISYKLADAMLRERSK